MEIPPSHLVPVLVLHDLPCEEFFHYSQREFPCCSSLPLPLVLLLCTSRSLTLSALPLGSGRQKLDYPSFSLSKPISSPVFVYHTFHSPNCPHLNSLYPFSLSISIFYWGPSRVWPIPQVCPQKCQVKRNNNLP